MWSEVTVVDSRIERCLLKTAANPGGNVLESVLFPTQNTHIEYNKQTGIYILRTSFLLNSVPFYSTNWESAKEYASSIMKSQFLLLRTRLEAAGIL